MLPYKADTYSDRQKGPVMNSSASDMQIFDDPPIQHDVKKTVKKSSLALFRPMGSEGMRLPPGLPTGLPKAPEESKKWKSTRETQNFFVMKSSPNAVPLNGNAQV